MKKLSLFFILILFCENLYSQDFNLLFGKNLSEFKINPKSQLIRCVADEYNESLISKKERESKEDFENWLAPRVAEMKKLLSSTSNKKTVIKIPVVVHVIHSGQSISNTARNITNERVLSQITVLNQDFRRMAGTRGYNTNPVGADIEVEFCLATVTPTGNATDGINRVNLGSTTWSSYNVENILKPQTIWDPTKYLNIWVCQFGGDLLGVLGFAQYPQSSGLSGLAGPYTVSTDGVIIDWRAFGSNDYVGGTYFQDIDKGRTTTHEVGHYLGLRHIWGDNNSCVVNATDSNNDYCLDTPAQNTENYDCFSAYDSCPNSPGLDMKENYLDYTNDTCMNVFTQDQKVRMLTVLQNSPRRASLTTSNVCTPVLASSEFSVAKEGLSIYPIPVKDYLTIDAKKGVKVVSYSIVNALGQQIVRKDVKSNADLKISKSVLGTGIFVITIYTEKSSQIFKFSVE